MVEFKHYEQSEISGIRIFDSEKHEQLWHFDEESRFFEVLEISGNWYFQWDDTLPQKLIPGDIIYIEKSEYHRLFGTGEIKINLYKI